MVIDNRADGALAQCCMCGKTDLSTAEDGGPECELHDGRWVCSSECWDIAVSIIGRLLVSRPAEPAQAAQVDANQRRADAATLLLDMLYMRNGAHEGLDRDAVEKMWNAVREDDGFPSVVQFLSVIAAAQEGLE